MAVVKFRTTVTIMPVLSVVEDHDTLAVRPAIFESDDELVDNHRSQEAVNEFVLAAFAVGLVKRLSPDSVVHYPPHRIASITVQEIRE